MKIKDELKTVGSFYVMTAIYWIAIGFMAAYWILYFSQLGLSFFQISLLLLMYPISALIFEIPTGAVADLFGRKISVFLSYALSGLAFIGVLLSGTNFPLLLFFYFLAGISFTLESGALEAWFVDTVNHKKESEHLHYFLGRWGSLSSIGFVVGPLLGSILVIGGVDKPFWATAITMLLLSFFVLLFGREDYFQQKPPKTIKAFQETLTTSKRGFTYLIKHPIILILTFGMGLLTLANTIYYNAYQPHVVQMGLLPSYLGIALSVAGFISIFSLNFSDKIKTMVGGSKKLLIISTLLFGFIILGVGLIKYLPLLFMSLVGVTALWEFAGHTSPAYREIFNKFAPSDIRATVISANSFNMKIGEIFDLLIFGFVSDYFGLQTGIVIAGVLVILTSFIYFKLGSKSDTIEIS